MSDEVVRIRELTGWGFDSYAYRPHASKQPIPSLAKNILAERLPLQQSHVLLTPETKGMQALFDSYAKRPDLLSEMAGLSWSLGMVDLRNLIAFQRRLAFSPNIAMPAISSAADWPALFALSFQPPKAIEYEITCIPATDCSMQTLILQSSNPDLHLRVTNNPASPLNVHAGGSFFEVACYRGRWFLRDGYHRAYALLAAGVSAVPAVIIQAATMEELGANHPWFFPEEVLFSPVPPRVIDFLNEDLVFEYPRPPFFKTIRIHMEEILQPAAASGEQQ